MTISSQRLNEETMEPDINLGSDDLTKQVDAGKYQLSITSTQFSVYILLRMLIGA